MGDSRSGYYDMRDRYEAKCRAVGVEPIDDHDGWLRHEEELDEILEDRKKRTVDIMKQGPHDRWAGWGLDLYDAQDVMQPQPEDLPAEFVKQYDPEGRESLTLAEKALVEDAINGYVEFVARRQAGYVRATVAASADDYRGADADDATDPARR